jgi:hypothetical protein
MHSEYSISPRTFIVVVSSTDRDLVLVLGLGENHFTERAFDATVADDKLHQAASPPFNQS